MINIKGKEVKTLNSEFTLGEFEQIIAIHGDENKGAFEKYLEIAKVLGLGDTADLITNDELMLFIQALSESQYDINDKSVVKKITIENIEYYAYDEKFELLAKDVSFIEKKIKTKTKLWLVYALAVIYKRNDLSVKEQYIDAHIKHKMSLFKDLPLAPFLPLIYYITAHFKTKVDKIIEQQTIKENTAE